MGDPKTSTTLTQKLVVLSFGCGVLCGWVIRNTRIASSLYAFVKFRNVAFRNGEYKLVLVVRNDLKMGKGKICAQCSHASIMAYKNASACDASIANYWEKYGQGKVVLQTDSEESLIKLQKKASNIGLLTNIVCDAGWTQVSPGTKTVLAIGPGRKDKIDEVTGNLKLL